MSSIVAGIRSSLAGFFDDGDRLLSIGYSLSEEDSWKASRPRIPALLFLALSFWFSTAYFFAASRMVEGPLLVTVGAAALAVTILLAVAVIRVRKARILVLIVLGIALGVASSAFSASTLKSIDIKDIEGCTYFALTSDAQKGSRNSFAQADAILDDGSKAHVRVYFGECPDALAGRILHGHGTVSELSDDAAERGWGQGIVANVYLTDAVVMPGEGIGAMLRDVRRQAIEALAGFGDASLFMQAILVGYRPDLYDSDLYQAVKVDGLAHLVAVSGAHLVIVVSMVGALLARLPVSRKALLGAQCVLLLAYLVVTAFPVSACRAAIMSLVSLCSVLARRRAFALQALSLCIVVMVATDSTCAASYSFVLSAASVLGISLFLGFFTEWLSKMLPGTSKTFLDLISVTLSSNIATIPLSAAWFSQVSAISVLSNLIAAPLFSFFCAGGLIITLAFVIVQTLIGGWLTGLLGLLMGAMLWLSDLFCGFLRLLSAMPFASFPISMEFWVGAMGSFALVALLWVVWPRPNGKFGWALVVLSTIVLMLCQCVIPTFAGPQIIMLDVGQGDAFVIRDGSSAMLVDTGTKDAELLQGLARHGVYRLDAVCISHPDDDHCGSLAALSGVVSVDRVLVAKDLLAQSDDNCVKLLRDVDRLSGLSSVSGLRTGDTLSFGVFNVKVIWPDRYAESGGNQDSLVLLVSWDVDSDGIEDGGALFCGDAERETIQKCMEQGRIKPVDVLKVGHHGSKVSLSVDIIGALKPKIGLISVGAFNRYGHPTQEALDALSAGGVKTYRTDTMGDVTLDLHPDKILVRTQRSD